MSKERLDLYLDPEPIRVVESLQEESKHRSELWDMSKSEAARELLEHGIEQLGENPDLEELIDDIAIQVYQSQKEHDKAKERGRVLDMVGGWRGRVKSRFNGRIAGEEPYPPEIMEELADCYWQEYEAWEFDSSRLERNEEWLDDLVEKYRDSYRAKDVLPEQAFEHVDGVETGSDLLRLRDRFDVLLRDIANVAESEAYDVDGMIRKVAGDYAVEEKTVELVIDELTSDDVDVRRALKSGEGILDKVDREALASWGGDLDAIDAPDDHDRDDEPELEVVDEEPEERGRDLGLGLEDMASEETIDAAEELLKSGVDEHEVYLELEAITGTPAQREAAVTVARRRLGLDAPDVVDELAAATDGGVESD